MFAFINILLGFFWIKKKQKNKKEEYSIWQSRKIEESLPTHRSGPMNMTWILNDSLGVWGKSRPATKRTNSTKMFEDEQQVQAQPKIANQVVL